MSSAAVWAGPGWPGWMASFMAVQICRKNVVSVDFCVHMKCAAAAAVTGGLAGGGE